MVTWQFSQPIGLLISFTSHKAFPNLKAFSGTADAGSRWAVTPIQSYPTLAKPYGHTGVAIHELMSYKTPVELSRARCDGLQINMKS